jgi:hypothetical protein
VLGDLPSSAMKATGEPMVAGLDSTMVGKNAGLRRGRGGGSRAAADRHGAPIILLS